MLAHGMRRRLALAAAGLFLLGALGLSTPTLAEAEADEVLASHGAYLDELAEVTAGRVPGTSLAGALADVEAASHECGSLDIAVRRVLDHLGDLPTDDAAARAFRRWGGEVVDTCR